MMSDDQTPLPPANEIPSATGFPRRQFLTALPLVGAAGVFALFAVGLTRNPSEIPSVMIGKSVPAFALPPVEGRQLGLGTEHLRGQVSLFNVFASWCVPCQIEHPLLMQLAGENALPVYGLNYKDSPEHAGSWLDANGDPYRRTGADRDGRVAIDFGVYGVPETFVIDGDGVIAHRHIGPLSSNDLSRTILPLVHQLTARRAIS
ncbi:MULTISPECIES: DsbE family thiol:disulfide interchange protein [unclassified Devosia]|uniref:DsbE family thiol:disulfide interchange protein n=1 Tax=unclassified Devosia TaxID=196773 RepID=UPI00086C8022|nr:MULTISPECIES: DsbE family thiol:disulfide interchange protein [unclassified Devosia]ODS87964.1 MAG: thiol:disulfide interchange protein [Devosia sp. SCN 66-27]OJX23123.1 MAG: thiol:disulfide interchange protein [Devosia sp. 66-14]